MINKRKIISKSKIYLLMYYLKNEFCYKFKNDHMNVQGVNVKVSENWKSISFWYRGSGWKFMNEKASFLSSPKNSIFLSAKVEKPKKGSLAKVEKSFWGGESWEAFFDLNFPQVFKTFEGRTF